MIDATVILPVYCVSELSLQYLRECLDSLDDQDCRVVACDDGSPLQVDVLKLLNSHKPIIAKIILSDKNYGVSHARNVCATEATTKLLLPLDCDDTLAPGAVKRLVDAFHGVPVYPDLAKFGLETVPWFRVLDFSCENVTKYVGFTSVNVLHAREQWKSVGGWDESIDFYEDGEYNARLFGLYCGERYPEPLVNYRQHDDQRTKKFDSQAKVYGKLLLNQIRSYNMACTSCGGKRRTASNLSPKNRGVVGNAGAVISKVAVGANTLNLPLEFEGKILALYIGGKGAGKHYYKGPKSKFPYRVQYGDYIYANPVDVVDRSDSANKLVRVKPIADKSSKPIVQKVATPEPKVLQSVSEPLEDVREVAEKVVELPDINTMSVSKILELVDFQDFDCNMAEKLLVAEQRGLNRSKVIAFLYKRKCDAG